MVVGKKAMRVIGNLDFCIGILQIICCTIDGAKLISCPQPRKESIALLLWEAWD